MSVSLVIDNEDDDDNDNQTHDKKTIGDEKKKAKTNTKKAGYRAPYSLGSAN